MKRSVLLFCGLFLSFLLKAQTNFKPGLVVTSAGDTLKGFIDHQEWIQNPGSIVFKTAGTSTTVQKLTPANTLYVEVLGLEAYQGARVSVSQSPVQLSNLTLGADTTSLLDTVFLKVVYAGPAVSLFSYRDKIKTRFYIKEQANGTSYQELHYRKYFKTEQPDHIATDPLYRNQLWALAIKYQDQANGLLNKIKTADYVKGDLLQIVRQLNGPEQRQEGTHSLEKLPRTRVLVGLWLNKTTMSNGTESLAGAEEHASYLPKLSLGLDAFINPATQRLLLRTELSVSMAEPRVRREVPNGPSVSMVYQYEYKQLSASLNPQALYHLYNGTQFKVHVAAGVIATAAHYAKDRYTFTYVIKSDQTSTSQATDDFEKPKTFWYSYTARAGLTLRNKLDVSLLYTPSRISRNKNYSIDTQSLSVGVSYLFSSKSR